MAQILGRVDLALLWFALGQGRQPPVIPEEPDANLARVMRRLDEGMLSGDALPRRPQLLPQLMSALHARGSNAATLAAIIGQDPVLSANLLRIANSAAYRRSLQPLENLERVVVKVGNDGLETLLASALVQPVLNLEDLDHRRMAAVLWRHAQLASASAADHARLVEGIDPLPLHLAAQLPSLANLLVVRNLDRLSNMPLDPLAQLQLLQRSQYALSAGIARRWELSEAVVEALAERQGPTWQALEFGRRFAWAWMQVEQGQLQEAHAREALAAHSPPHVVDWVWNHQKQKVER